MSHWKSLVSRTYQAMESIMFFFFKKKPIVKTQEQIDKELLKEKQIIEENRQKLIDKRKRLKFELAIRMARERKRNNEKF